MSNSPPTAFEVGNYAGIAGSLLGSGASLASLVAGTGINAAAAGGAIGGTAVAGALTAGIGAAVIGVYELVQALSGGCGQACIVPSKIVQVFQVAGVNLNHIRKAGGMSDIEYNAALQLFLQAAIQVLQKDSSVIGSHLQASIANISHTTQLFSINNPSTASATMRIPQSQWHSYYIGGIKGPTATGYYPESVAAGLTISDKYLSALPAIAPPSSSLGTSSPLDFLTSASASSSSSPLLLLAGAAYLALKIL